MYTGKIIHDEPIQDVDRIVINEKGETLDLEASLRFVNHSPTGFCWGYYGSGPAQLAFAILSDYLGDPARALALYQGFKDMVIARLPMDEDFVLTDEQIENAITAIDVAQMRS